MNTSDRVKKLVDRLNTLTLGTPTVDWNTPLAFHLTSTKPGSKRIYALERNEAQGSGVQVWHSGYIREVYDYAFGLRDGIELGLENRDG